MSSLRIPIIVSALIHISLIIFLSTLPHLGFSLRGDRPTKIMWIELPRGTSDDIGLGMKKSEGLPKSTIEEQKNLFQQPPPEQEPMEPKMQIEQKEKKAEKKQPEKKPKVEAKTTRSNEPRMTSNNKRIRDALAKINKNLKNRTIVPESAQISANQDGYKYGTGTEPLKVSPSDPEYLKYQAMVRAKIIQEWIIPMKFTEDGAPQYSSRLEVMINDSGEVVSIRWDTPSGNATFDQSAVRAVKMASPFPKPPEKLAWEAYNEGFLVEFDPRLKPRY